MDFMDTALADFAENDLKELWNSDYYAEALRTASELDWSGVLESPASSGGISSSGGGVVLNDRLMTEASLGVISQLGSLGSLGTLSSLGNLSSLLAQHQQDGGVTSGTTNKGGPIVKTEHSYSVGTEGPASTAISKADTTDIDSECFPAIPIGEAEGTSITSNNTTTSNHSSDNSSDDEETSSNSSFLITTSTSNNSSFSTNLASSLASLAQKGPLLSTMPGLEPLPTFTTRPIKTEKQQTSSIISVPSIKTSMGLARPAAVVVTQRSGPLRGSGTTSTHTIRTTTPSSSIPSASSMTFKLTSAGDSPTSSSDTGFYLPPTPPSCSSSDSGSEYGGCSPSRTTPLYEHLTPQFCNPRKSCARITVSSRNPINTPLISTQPKGVTGPINLTEEEKRTLVSEGYSVPTRLPLTKAEEKSLKKIRRKIKNKISAQESRRKKKDYMDTLERKLESVSQENMEYKRRIEALQTSNSQLLVELHRLQTNIQQDEKNRRRSTTIATTTS